MEIKVAKGGGRGEERWVCSGECERRNDYVLYVYLRRPINFGGVMDECVE